MRNLLSPEGPLMSFLTKITYSAYLNILWFICCLPIVTAGASTTALFYVTLKVARNEEGRLTQAFFHSFKENFRQATKIWLILLAGGTVLWLDFQIMEQAGSGGIFQAVYLGLCFILLIYGMISAYIFPLLAKFDNTVKNTFKNSLLMSIRHLPYTILLLLITYVPMFLTLNYGVVLVYGAVVWLAAGFALTAFINSHIYMRIYKNYIPEEAQENDSEWTLGE